MKVQGINLFFIVLCSVAFGISLTMNYPWLVLLNAISIIMNLFVVYKNLE